MKVATKLIRCRHDWLSLEAERGTVQVSLLAHRNEIIVDVTIDGQRHEAWVSPRELASFLRAGIHVGKPDCDNVTDMKDTLRPHVKPVASEETAEQSS